MKNDPDNQEPPVPAAPAQGDTTTVFNVAPLIAQEHQWVQRGYHIEDACNPSRPDCHNGGIPIGEGKLLIKDSKGVYRIEDESDLSVPERQQQQPAAS